MHVSLLPKFLQALPARFRQLHNGLLIDAIDIMLFAEWVPLLPGDTVPLMPLWCSLLRQHSVGRRDCLPDDLFEECLAAGRFVACVCVHKFRTKLN